MPEPTKQQTDQQVKAFEGSQADPRQLFRESIQDLIVVCEKLSENCESVEDLAGMLNLALTNEGQLKFLMSLITRKKFGQ